MGSKQPQPAPKINPFRVGVEAREICDICFSVIRVGYEITVDDWFSALPKDLQKKNLCLKCFTRYADEKRVAWDKSVKFFPVSLVTQTHD